MKFYIINKNNNKKQVITQDKEIDFIHVIVSAGDEIAKVVYKDGDEDWFDSRGLYNSYYQGDYIVNANEIDQWTNWPKNKYKRHYIYVGSMAHERLVRFKRKETVETCVKYLKKLADRYKTS